MRQASQKALLQDGIGFFVALSLGLPAAAALFLRDLGVEGRPSGVKPRESARSRTNSSTNDSTAAPITANVTYAARQPTALIMTRVAGTKSRLQLWKTPSKLAARPRFLSHQPLKILLNAMLIHPGPSALTIKIAAKSCGADCTYPSEATARQNGIVMIISTRCGPCNHTRNSVHSETPWKSSLVGG